MEDLNCDVKEHVSDTQEQTYFDIISNITLEVTKVQKFDTFAYYAFIAIIDLVMSKDKEYVKAVNKNIDKKPIIINDDIQKDIEVIVQDLNKG